ncbi:MAG: hypothetical protein KJ046_01265 [Anaerolineae bacterium]|nr:hypothetical protein [Anaerolineae bacterium]RIK24055.1 MAG: hypothetical protein DCC51_01465 [Anaerolineae bacterium]
MQKKENRFKRVYRVAIFIIAAIALAGFIVDDFRQELVDPPAARLLPDLPGYRQVEGQTITTYIGALSEGAALLAGQPQLAMTVGAIDHVVDCYQEVGGVRARVYSQATAPLHAGLVAVVDETRANDPDLLFRCVAPVALGLESTDGNIIEPCTAAYTVVLEEGTFHVIYAGSAYDVCVDFCSSLEGCTTHSTLLPG